MQGKYRAIVIFGDKTCLFGQFEDSATAYKWCNSFDSARNAHSNEHGGVYHQVLYDANSSNIIFETEH